MTAVSVKHTLPWKGLNSIGLVACAALFGYFGWGEYVVLLAAVALMPTLWSLAPSRVSAGLVLFVYYLAAARSMPHGLGVYFGETKPSWFGYGLWLLTALLLTLPWLLLWSKRMSWASAAWRLSLVLILTAIPPLGFFGWAHPLTAAGALLPGWGWWGLMTVWIGMMASCVLRGRGAVFLGLAFGVIVFVSFRSSTVPEQPHHWQGAETQFGGVPPSAQPSEGNLTYMMRAFQNNQRMMQKATAATQTSDVSVILFPESMAGPWSQTTQGLWSRVSTELVSKNATVLTGAEEFHPNGGYDNVIVGIGSESGVKYRQRMPVPVAMWNPLSDRGAVAHWLSSGVFDVAGQRVAGLICYEQLLLWPVLVSMANGAQMIAAPANMWWSRETDLPAIQRSAVAAWARLFAVPLVTAFNT